MNVARSRKLEVAKTNGHTSCQPISATANVYCWRLFGSAKHSKEPTAVISGQAWAVRGTEPDGPRPGARRRCSLVKRGRSTVRGRTVRDLAQGLAFPAWRPDGPRPRAGRSARAQGATKVAGGAWISLPGGTPSGRRDPRGCLGSGRPT
jgi:hypothetical protein